jgi:GntR family transcriptional repressor for pyruvate dehydrogenase complex
MLKPVEKQRVAEEIAEQLRSLILNGQYPPGSKLPPERELSKRLRVNRASLR